MSRGTSFITDRRLLEAVRAHRPQTIVGDELPALLVVVIAVHEGVFFRLPVEALELVGVLGLTLLAQHALHVLGDARADQAVHHGLSWRVHVALGEPHAPLAVHRCEIGLTGGPPGSHTWQASPIFVGTMSTSTAKRPPCLIAPKMAFTIALRSP